ncbi:MAG TPA: VOC family protein [Puia sp.]|jgi:predicted 3-demethylubiquinone-9 3-methyltransferase (glyoxalase superfamily)
MTTNKNIKISTCLWFDNQAEEAVKYYTSILPDSKTGKITRYGREGYDIHKKPAGSVMTVQFWLLGNEYLALNGGPLFRFNESISLVVQCETQEEIDRYWEKLSEGGDKSAQACGWLKDKYGLSWQIVPRLLEEMQNSPDTEKTERLMNAIMKMKKLDIAALKRAFDNKDAGSQIKKAPTELHSL